MKKEPFELFDRNEKAERAKKLRDFFKELEKDEKAGHEIFWHNVWQRAKWILEV